MPTPCETFYDQDYLDLNTDVKNANMNPREHWRNHGSKEKGADGSFNRRFNKQCNVKVFKEPIEFNAGSSTPVTAKTITKVVVSFSDGTTTTTQ